MSAKQWNIGMEKNIQMSLCTNIAFFILVYFFWSVVGCEAGSNPSSAGVSILSGVCGEGGKTQWEHHTWTGKDGVQLFIETLTEGSGHKSAMNHIIALYRPMKWVEAGDPSPYLEEMIASHPCFKLKHMKKVLINCTCTNKASAHSVHNIAIANLKSSVKECRNIKTSFSRHIFLPISSSPFTPLRLWSWSMWRSSRVACRVVFQWWGRQSTPLSRGWRYEICIPSEETIQALPGPNFWDMFLCTCFCKPSILVKVLLLYCDKLEFLEEGHISKIVPSYHCLINFI